MILALEAVPMDALYDQILHRLDGAFRKMEGMVPPPQRVQRANGYVLRYQEKTIQQAILQKLARIVSGLHAARMLFDSGFVQEQAAVQRMVDEFHEDVLFLAFGVIKEETPLHREYLEEFYKEEDNRMVKRRKIREYIANIDGVGDGDAATAASRTLYGTYSGFLHGASPQIMDLAMGDPPRFRIHGVGGTPVHDDHRYDLYNPFFRAIISFAVAAKALGDDDLCQTLQAFHLEVDAMSGRNQAYRPERPQ
jgi:hypothetical protein